MKHEQRKGFCLAYKCFFVVCYCASMNNAETIVKPQANYRGQTPDSRNKPSATEAHFIQECEIELEIHYPISRQGFSDFLLRYCTTNPGRKCNEVSSGNLPSEFNMMLLEWSCTTDSATPLICVSRKQKNDFDTVFHGNLNQLCRKTFPLLQTLGYLDSRPQQYFGSEVLPPDNYSMFESSYEHDPSPSPIRFGNDNRDETMGSVNERLFVRSAPELNLLARNKRVKKFRSVPSSESNSMKSIKSSKMPKGSTKSFTASSKSSSLASHPILSLAEFPTVSPSHMQPATKKPVRPVVSFIGNFSVVDDNIKEIDDVSTDNTSYGDFVYLDDDTSEEGMKGTTKSKGNKNMKNPSLAAPVTISPTVSPIPGSTFVPSERSKLEQNPKDAAYLSEPTSAPIQEPKDGKNDISFDRKNVKSFRGKLLLVLALVAATTIFCAVFASLSSRRRFAKREEQACVAHSDPALHGDPSVTSENSQFSLLDSKEASFQVPDSIAGYSWSAIVSTASAVVDPIRKIGTRLRPIRSYVHPSKGRNDTAAKRMNACESCTASAWSKNLPSRWKYGIGRISLSRRQRINNSTVEQYYHLNRTSTLHISNCYIPHQSSGSGRCLPDEQPNFRSETHVHKEHKSSKSNEIDPDPTSEGLRSYLTNSRCCDEEIGVNAPEDQNFSFSLPNLQTTEPERVRTLDDVEKGNWQQESEQERHECHHVLSSLSRGEVLHSPTTLARGPGLLYSEFPDDESLGSLEFLSPAMKDVFREVDQCLSSGFNGFKESDLCVSEDENSSEDTDICSIENVHELFICKSSDDEEQYRFNNLRSYFASKWYKKEEHADRTSLLYGREPGT